MRLQNNLYKIVNEATDAYTVELVADSLIYKAHFPEKPITPGVCIIQIATELLELLTGKKLSLAEVINAKYLSVINPDETGQVTYTFTKMVLDDELKTFKVQAVVASESTICTKLSLLYHIDE